MNSLHRRDGADYGGAIVTFTEQPAVLVLAGDEDRTTQSRRRGPLSRALQVKADVTVDMSALVWADASVILDLAMIARRLRKVGHRLLVSGAQPQIARLIELVGLHRLEGVVMMPAAA